MNIQEAGYINFSEKWKRRNKQESEITRALGHLFWFFIKGVNQLTIYEVTHRQDKWSSKGEIQIGPEANCCDFQISRPGLGRESKPQNTARVRNRQGKKSSHPRLPGR